MSAAICLERPSSLPEIDIPRIQKEADNLRGEDLIRYAHKIFGPRLALLSSFGTESALLLHMVAEVKKDMLVLFIDTEKLHPETLAYKDRLIAKLGLTNVQTIKPDPRDVAAEDPLGVLYEEAALESGSRPCCDLRKVRPLERALQSRSLFERLEGPLAKILGDRVAIINGVKGHHGGLRQNAPKVTSAGNRTDFSPLADYSRQEIEQAFRDRGLPDHPLKFKFPSIGCDTPICTKEPLRPEDFRSGRMDEGAYCEINLSDRHVRASFDSSQL